MKWTVTDSGKNRTMYTYSGVEHNPAPRTKRGLRRMERRMQNVNANKRSSGDANK